MDKFSNIYKRAAKRKGGKAHLDAMLPAVLNEKAIQKISDDHFLAEFSRCLFQAGFVWRVVNQKWPDFEKVFFGFKPEKIALLSPEQIEKIGSNAAIIRNMQKIISVQQNAQFILDESKKHGSFAQMISDWPQENLVGLYKYLKIKGARLGGATGSRALRNLGIDTFLLSNDVILCLQQSGVQIANKPTSQKDMTLIQTAFNTWHRETGLPYTHLSRICGYATGTNSITEANH